MNMDMMAETKNQKKDFTYLLKDSQKHVCNKCLNKRSAFQRSAVNSAPDVVSPIVHEVLRSSGQPLYKQMREYMEPRFGHASDATAPTCFAHDFSGIPMHTRASNVQPKLRVNTPGDQYEKEADCVADQVMHMPDLTRSTGQASMMVPAPFHSTTERVMHQSTQRKIDEEIDPEKQRVMINLLCTECEDLPQAKEASSEGVRVSTEFESQIESVRAGGLPLPNSMRDFFEPKFGYDFSKVIIHTDTQAGDTAKQMNALAYTIGSHIVFAPGQFAPNSHEGKKLLAHELAHVVQQSPTRMSPCIANTFSTNIKRNSFETQLPVQSFGSAIGIRMQAGSETIFRHTKENCDNEYELCCNGCRNLPNRTKIDKARRALCWSRCATEYGACLASSEEAVKGLLTGLAIVAAIVLASADGPFPIGDAAAVALLALVGIKVTD